MIEFRVPRCVASSKNRRRTFYNRKAGRVVSLPSEQATLDIALLKQLAREAMAGKLPFGENDLLRLEVEHECVSDTLVVRVKRIGEIVGNGVRYTRRDCHGMIETIADALQGVAYGDDRMIDAGSWQRVRP